MVAMWAIALGIVVVQRDLGAALLFFAVFLALLYVATGRPSYVLGGLVLFIAGSWVLYQLFGHVQAARRQLARPVAATRRAPGSRWSRRCTPSGGAACSASGLGAGLPTIGGRLPVPAVHTDYPLAAIGEELGPDRPARGAGPVRGRRVAWPAHRCRSRAMTSAALLAAGLALVVGIQAFIIAAGNLKLIPLTGITLPLISYGGSSLLANAIVVGLLLALSDRGPEPPSVPSTRRRTLARLGRRSA